MEADETEPGMAEQAPPAGAQPPGNPADLPIRRGPAADAHEPPLPRRIIWYGAAVFAASLAALTALDLAIPSQWSMLDLQIYRWGGLLVRHSGDLYGLRFPHYHLRFTYSPMAALIFAAMSFVALPILKWVAEVGNIASLVAALWVTWGALGYRRSAGRIGLTLAAAGVALWLEPVVQTLGFGQVNLILMLIVVADLCAQDARWYKGVGVGLAAGLKLTPLIFIPYLLLTRRFRAAGVAIATFALTIAGSLILLPTQSRQFWFGGLFLNAGRVGNVAYVGNQSLRGALTRLLGSESAAQPYWVAAALAGGICGLLLAAWAARRGHKMTGIVTCALTGLLISPVSWSHHWVWCAPALVVAADLAIRAKAHRLAGWACVAVLAIAFLTLPQGLVPPAMVQGSGVHGTWLLTGSLYVIVATAVGIAGLCVGLTGVGTYAANRRTSGPGNE